MNRQFWEEFVTCPSFADYTTEARELFIKHMTTTNPTKDVSSEVFVFDTPDPKSSNMEASTPVPTMLRSPRLKQFDAKEKKKKLISVRQSLRKNVEVRQTEKKDKQLEKVVDLEEEEHQGVEELDAEEVEPISWLLPYIPL